MLDRFGFGENFKLLIKMLYSSPKSAIFTNSDKSAFFPLQRGTHQGCCLSPLLFDLALEPLAIHIRNHSGIRGITCGHTEVKLLALPVFRHYYWATNARAMMFWQMSDQAADSSIDSQPKWSYMEAQSVVGSSLAAILSLKLHP